MSGSANFAAAISASAAWSTTASFKLPEVVDFAGASNFPEGELVVGTHGSDERSTVTMDSMGADVEARREQFSAGISAAKLLAKLGEVVIGRASALANSR